MASEREKVWILPHRYEPDFDQIPNAYMSKNERGHSMTDDFKEYCDTTCVPTKRIYEACVKGNKECMSEYMTYFNCLNSCVTPKVFKYLHIPGRGTTY